MMKWIKRLLAVVAAIAAILFGLRERRQRVREEAELLNSLNDDATASTARADAAAERGKAHALQAKALQHKAKAATETIKDRADEDFATTVDRINARLAGRLRDD